MADAVGSKTHSSLVTIFAIWNTMLGTSMLTMPWAVAQAGIGASIICFVIVGALCLYTTYRVVDSPRFLQEAPVNPDTMPSYRRLVDPAKRLMEPARKNEDIEFVDVCAKLLGPIGRWVAVIFSAVALLGTTIVFWELMSKFLHNLGLFVYDVASGHHTLLKISNPLECHGNSAPSNITDDYETEPDFRKNTWIFGVLDNRFTWPCVLSLVVFPLVSIRDAGFTQKFTALGTLSAIYLLGFVTYHATEWGVNIEFSNSTSVHYDAPFKTTFVSLTGVLCMSFFVQNCILTLLKLQNNPAKNTRDLCIAFGLVAATYLLIGIPFYLTFPLKKGCISANFVGNFAANDNLATVTRAFLLLQYLSLFPLIASILRDLVLKTVCKSPDSDYLRNCLFNSALIGVCIFITIFVPQIGIILRYCGAMTGMAYVFALPSIVYMVGSRKHGKLGIFGGIFHSVLVVLGVINMLAQFLESYFLEQ
ncbi:sodium-coupled neutral amino acid transporter 9 homolog [Galendromus occidentalis]|uniref:Sodium-coupled neutral amino acid transporter 9 homolog n=1 Tax=Galendromus occidentalis TaxID=34638 RepID=A0AAJ6VYP3_9ACAR|nr:sodium-coupled neutral amino acid transporter 9 homolog [Galendromus occidentalis]